MKKLSNSKEYYDRRADFTEKLEKTLVAEKDVLKKVSKIIVLTKKQFEIINH